MRSFATALSLLAAPFFAACGGATAAATGGDAGVSSDGSTQPLVDASPVVDAAHEASPCTGPNCNPPPPTTDAGTPPPNPNGPPPDGSGDVVLAMNKVYLGDTDWNDVASSTAWKQFGFNIDGLVTDRNSTDVCALAPGAARAMQADGNAGIDNSYGENILPIILSTAGANASSQINDSIKFGSFTMLIDAAKLGTGPSYSGIVAKMYGGAPTSAPPKWNGTDVWPVDSTTVVNGDVSSPLAKFGASYMTNRVLVLAPASGKIVLPLQLFPTVAASGGIPLTHAQIALGISPDNTTGTQGIVSGVIPTDEFIAYLKTIAGRISTSLCSGSAFDSIAAEIRQAQDILLDGTNGAGVACNGISLGIGFTAKAVGLGPVTTVVPPPDPCGP